MRLLAAFSAVFLCTLSAWAQNRVSGRVSSSTSGEGVSGVSVRVPNSTIGAITDTAGYFQLSVPSLPVTLIFSSIGYETQEIRVASSGANLAVSFVPSNLIGQEVVVSAARTPQRILEAPVTIERVSAATIRNSPVSNYYDIVSNLKGVDVVLSSLTFRTPTTRGFVGSGNLRFNQIMDGMDNQAPGLNFSVGSVIGLTELDVESMELLPGATSALYGPGGMNGTLIINSKNPFRHTGFSAQVKSGVMHIDNKERDPSPYYNASLRWAQKVSEKFAYKISGEVIHARDWLARDYRNYRRYGTTGQIVEGDITTDPNYDGVNVYGDEVPDQVPTFANVLRGIGGQIPFLRDYLFGLADQQRSDMKIARTGYTENQVIDPVTKNIKLSGSLNYKIGRDIEAVLAGYWGTGNTVYTGSQRYSLKDLKVGQYKVELNAKNWFLRGYTTQENAGESHNLTVTSQLFNEGWKPTSVWLQQYAFTYINSRQGGQNDMAAHQAARAVADQGRPVAGSAQFKRIFDSVRLLPIPKGGLFTDRSDLWMAEGQYNFSNDIKFAEIMVGGNWKQYVLNSEGTLFADTKGNPIKINEYGGYVQIGREVIKDRLRLTASGRYDKNENFKGRFTPRVTAVIKPATDHNIRLSFQTAYRFPSTQQQWIDLDVGTGRLLGSNIFLYQKYDLINNRARSAQNPAEEIPYREVKPEAVTSYEVGYKALINKKFLIDVYGYNGAYKDFITRRDAIQTQGSTQRGFSLVANSPQKVNTYGWGIGLEYVLPFNFIAAGSLSSDRIDGLPAGYRAFFNAPLLRSVLSLTNTGFGRNKRLGANVSWRWQDGFFYENDFTQGDLPAYHTVDAALSYKVPKIKSMIKLGASNLLNQYYRTALGNPSVGGLYYVSFAYGVL